MNARLPLCSWQTWFWWTAIARQHVSKRSTELNWGTGGGQPLRGPPVMPSFSLRKPLSQSVGWTQWLTSRQQSTARWGDIASEMRLQRGRGFRPGGSLSRLLALDGSRLPGVSSPRAEELMSLPRGCELGKGAPPVSPDACSPGRLLDYSLKRHPGATCRYRHCEGVNVSSGVVCSPAIDIGDG